MATAKKKLVQWEPTDIKKELLKKYPTKVARRRAKQILINEALENTTPEIVANVRTIPGIITMRGCTYAGCKGVIMGPTRDIVNLVHGPIGCSFYAWLTRRNQTDAGVDGENFMPYCFSTDMQDSDIIFGGEKKLAAGHSGDLRPVPPQGDHHFRHLSGGPDRRRHPYRCPQHEGKARRL